jgi:N-acetylneuraminate synthase
LDLDEQGYEFNFGHCWNPQSIKSVIEDVRSGINADGKILKEPHKCELEERNWRADPSDGLRPMINTRK